MLMSLSVFTASAQQLEGAWVATGDFISLLNSSGQNEFNIQLGLSIEKEKIYMTVVTESSDDEMQMEMLMYVPGTYQRTGSNITCKFQKDKVD